MKVIGLTGASGSGKSMVTLLLSQLTEIFIIDADKIGHQIILKGNPAYYDIIQHFGSRILSDDGEINRKYLGELVFSNNTYLEILNQITHPRIREEIIKEIKLIEDSSFSYNYIVIDAPLLIEVKLYDVVDEVWAVYADVETRIKRIINRDGISIEQALNRIKSQIPWEEMKKYAHRIIDNGKDMEYTKRQLKYIVEGM